MVLPHSHFVNSLSRNLNWDTYKLSFLLYSLHVTTFLSKLKSTHTHTGTIFHHNTCLQRKNHCANSWVLQRLKPVRIGSPSFALEFQTNFDNRQQNNRSSWCVSCIFCVCNIFFFTCLRYIQSCFFHKQIFNNNSDLAEQNTSTRHYLNTQPDTIKAICYFNFSVFFSVKQKLWSDICATF